MPVTPAFAALRHPLAGGGTSPLYYYMSISKQFIFKVDQIDFFGRSGDGRIEPFKVIDSQFLLPERVVDEHALPLASLRLMAGDGIGIFQLEGLLIFIFTHRLIPLLFGRDMGIILIHSLIEHIRLFVCEGGAFGVQSIQDHLRHNLLIVIIRE